MKTIYLANPYGFSEQQKRLLIPELVGELEALGLEVWEPFARNNQVDLSKPGWVYMVGQADLRDVRDSDATFAVVNGTPPDDGVSIGHTFRDDVAIPLKKPRVSLRGMLPPHTKKEYEKQYSKEIYKWARDNGLCGICKREPSLENLTVCGGCQKETREYYRRRRAKRRQEDNRTTNGRSATEGHEPAQTDSFDQEATVST